MVDNCEQVLEAAASAVGSLLEGCPRLRVLATSRQPLRIRGESVRALGPLDPEEAVRLFHERAQAARADAAAAEATAVRAICERLEGIPLVLELAAARIAVLSPNTLLSRLDAGLDLLSRDARGGLARQHSVRATVEWSFELLSPSEQAGFTRLAVFPGSFSLEAVETVAQLTVEMLDSLVSKSLLSVLRAPGRELRYRLLDTLRGFGRERLRAGAEELELSRRRPTLARRMRRTCRAAGRRRAVCLRLSLLGHQRHALPADRASRTVA